MPLFLRRLEYKYQFQLFKNTFYQYSPNLLDVVFTSICKDIGKWYYLIWSFLEGIWEITWDSFFLRNVHAQNFANHINHSLSRSTIIVNEIWSLWEFTVDVNAYTFYKRRRDIITSVSSSCTWKRTLYEKRKLWAKSSNNIYHGHLFPMKCAWFILAKRECVLSFLYLSPFFIFQSSSHDANPKSPKTI